jgi:outer membrane protein assembly factor BamA
MRSKINVPSLKIRLLCLLVVGLFCRQVNGQRFSLSVQAFEPSDAESISLLEHDEHPKTLEAFVGEIERIQKRLEEMGYLNLKRTEVKDPKTGSLTAKLQLSKKVKHLILTFPKGTEVPSAVSLNKERQAHLSFEQFAAFIKALTDSHRDSGRPFSSVKLKNIVQKKDRLWALVEVRESPLRKIDKVVVRGYVDFPKKFIPHHLQLKPKTVYSEKKLRSASRALKSLDFVSEVRPPEVLFLRDSTHAYLYLERKRSNRFDALLGFTTDSKTNQVQFNGYLDIHLENRFQKGETIALKWNNNGNGQEEFRLKTKFRYLFHSPFDQELAFEIYRQEASFSNVKGLTKIDYRFDLRQQLGIKLSFENSEKTAADEALSSARSFSSNFYGIYYHYTKPPSSKNRSKWALMVGLEQGKRKTQEKSTDQQQLEASFSCLGVLSRKTRLFLQNRAKQRISDDLLFNELYRLGGTNSVRGFNELSLFASRYNYTNIEYRWMTQTDSYLFGFSDIGFLENKALKTAEQLLSFGLGYAYQTPSGRLHFSYAFGKTQKQDFNLNRGLFHLKWERLF